MNPTGNKLWSCSPGLPLGVVLLTNDIPQEYTFPVRVWSCVTLCEAILFSHAILIRQYSIAIPGQVRKSNRGATWANVAD
jgi:hypothetical protein